MPIYQFTKNCRPLTGFSDQPVQLILSLLGDYRIPMKGLSYIISMSDGMSPEETSTPGLWRDPSVDTRASSLLEEAWIHSRHVHLSMIPCFSDRSDLQLNDSLCFAVRIQSSLEALVKFCLNELCIFLLSSCNDKFYRLPSEDNLISMS